MPNINFLISKHQLPAIIEPVARPYMPKKNEYDDWRVGQLGRAMKWIERHVVNRPKKSQTCDEAFVALPGGKTFVDLWGDANIWISFHTDPDPTLFGQAVRHGKDLAVAYGAFRLGWRAVAATLIHEFAHLNGAGSKTSDAEDTLLHCGLKKQHDPTVIGFLETMPASAVRFV